MIQASELRIGNWVVFNDNTDRYGQVFLITGTEVQMSTNYIPDHWENSVKEVGIGIDSVFPIHLTPDILEQAGFEKQLLDEGNEDEGYCYSLRLNDNKYCGLSFLSGDKNGYTEVCLFPYEEWFRCRYVHQLQNWYFALTGKELSLTL